MRLFLCNVFCITQVKHRLQFPRDKVRLHVTVNNYDSRKLFWVQCMQTDYLLNWKVLRRIVRSNCCNVKYSNKRVTVTNGVIITSNYSQIWRTLLENDLDVSNIVQLSLWQNNTVSSARGEYWPVKFSINSSYQLFPKYTKSLLAIIVKYGVTITEWDYCIKQCWGVYEQNTLWIVSM